MAATYAFESSPLVVDRVMFLSGRDGYVWALDAETGQELWRYKHEIPLDTPLCCGNVNRGVAVARGKVFFASQNGYLVARQGKQYVAVPAGWGGWIKMPYSCSHFHSRKSQYEAANKKGVSTWTGKPHHSWQ